MQEINYARQESGARSSEPKQRRCAVCDGPVERPHLVCRECWYRDMEEQEWESYLEFMGSDDTTQNPEVPAENRSGSRIPHKQPMLVVLCGPSHAGKTTFARGLGDNFTVVSPDEIRKRLSISFGDSKREAEVWEIYEAMKRKALAEGSNVILDACHITKQARWHSLQGPNAKHRKICIVFDLSLRTVRERCLTTRRMSIKEVERMLKDFQNNKPTTEELKREGFDEVYFIREQRPMPIRGLAMQRPRARNLIRMGVHYGQRASEPRMRVPASSDTNREVKSCG